MSAAWMGRALTEVPATGSKCLCQGSCGGICSLSEQGYTLDSLKLLSSFGGICRRAWCQAGNVHGGAERAQKGSGGSLLLHFCPQLFCFQSSTNPALNECRFSRGWEPCMVLAGRHPPPHGAFLWGLAPTEADPPPQDLSPVIPADKEHDVCSGTGSWRGGMGQRKKPADPWDEGAGIQRGPCYGQPGSPDR